jgi:glutamine---fructose-6-phosphate transaminase (isomerizing)
VKSLGKFPDSFGAELDAQPDAVRAAAAGLADQTAGLEALKGAAARARSIVFTGMGGSYDVCHVPVTLLAEAGVAAVMVDGAELLHFRRPILRGGSLLVAASQSGESAELVRLLEAAVWADGRPTIVTVTNGSENSLARASDVAFDTRAGQEAGPSTKTFAAALVVLAAVARVLSGEAAAEAAAAVAAEAEVAADALQTLLDRGDELRTKAAAWLGERSMLAVLGRGTARACAEMAALLVKEAAGFPAESLEAGQFRHGPLELAGPDLAAAVVATEPVTRDLDFKLAADLERAGASVMVLGGGSGTPAVNPPAAYVGIGTVPRALSAAVAMVPFQLLAQEMAGARGRDPLRLQVASKVTTHE